MTDQSKKYLSDILTAIELIESFINDIETFESYSSDLKTQSAVERQLGIIGEAVSKYDKSFPNNTLKNAHKIVGFRNGFFKKSEITEIINDIKKVRPDILLIGLPTPIKEELALLISKKIPSVLNVTVGGIFDVFAEEKQMAPTLISKLCIEWFYRMIQEPKRLFKRYLRTNFLFFIMVVRESIRRMF